MISVHDKLFYLHITLKLQEVVSVPRDEPRSLVREVHTPKTGLSSTEKCLTDGVVVRPHKIVVDGDVFKKSGVTIRAKQLLIAARGDDVVRVHGPLGLVQSIHECAPFCWAQG